MNTYTFTNAEILSAKEIPYSLNTHVQFIGDAVHAALG